MHKSHYSPKDKDDVISIHIEGESDTKTCHVYEDGTGTTKKGGARDQRLCRSVIYREKTAVRCNAQIGLSSISPKILLTTHHLLLVNTKSSQMQGPHHQALPIAGRPTHSRNLPQAPPDPTAKAKYHVKLAPPIQPAYIEVICYEEGPARRPINDRQICIHDAVPTSFSLGLWIRGVVRKVEGIHSILAGQSHVWA